jgi:hypothetical protein
MGLDDWFSIQKTPLYADDTMLVAPCSECWALVRVDDAEQHQRWHEQIAARLTEE